LGKELYAALAARFPVELGHRSRLWRYKDGLQQDFENTMATKVCLENPTLDVLTWQRKIASYFAGFTLDSTGDDLYSRLLAFLQRTGKIKHCVFASLNYECIFEQAADKLEIQVDYSCGERRDEGISVLKPHGSCSFITPDIRQWEHQLTNPNAHLACGMECLSPVGIEETLAAKLGPKNCNYPVMSLYSLGKDSLVAGMKIQEIRNAWSTLLLGASAEATVAVIGVRPNSGDTHVWTPIQNTSAKLLYIGSENDSPIWASAKSRCIRFLPKTFEDGFNLLLGCLDS
jgi:hypothetical protein